MSSATDNSQKSHTSFVAEQFGAQARAYLESAVHSAGEDLDIMEKAVGERPDAIALDMGCGGGHVTFRLAPHVAKIVAYDLSTDMLQTVAGEAAKRGLSNVVTKQGAAENLPCPDNSFDVVATRFSAHHWRDAPGGLAQMHRAMKPGGIALFADAVASEDPLIDTWLQTIEVLRDPSHVRDYKVSEWESMAKAAGFRVLETKRQRIRLEFSSWIKRIRTPEVNAAAIRALEQQAPAEVARHFAFEADGSFMLDTAVVIATRD
jgi:ubiquinone/menaquinone biosynthesis C-methylase UbiE